MALDWNKDVSLSSLTNLFKRKKGAPGASSAYPTKVTMNLYQTGAEDTDVRKVVGVGVLLAVLIILFVKFGVLDPLAAVAQKEGELAQQKAVAATMNESLANYAEIKERYESFMTRYGEDSTDAISVLDMIEQRVMKTTTVTAIVLADNTLTLTLYNVPLDTAGNLAKDLEGQDMVSSVNVTTATTENLEGKNTVSTLVVTLIGSESEEE